MAAPVAAMRCIRIGSRDTPAVANPHPLLGLPRDLGQNPGADGASSLVEDLAFERAKRASARSLAGIGVGPPRLCRGGGGEAHVLID
jgi:hypothetical protein